MKVKNDSKRLITINFKDETLNIIPTATVELSSEQTKEIKNNKIVQSWLKDGSLIEVKEASAKKAPAKK